MDSSTITLACVSLTTLLLGFYAWRLTSSKSIIFNTALSSPCLLLAAYFAQKHEQAGLTYTIPFLVFALFGGRAIGLGLRVKKEPELYYPTAILGTIAAFALGAAVVVFLAR